jgi:hypothetical protein
MGSRTTGSGPPEAKPPFLREPPPANLRAVLHHRRAPPWPWIPHVTGDGAHGVTLRSTMGNFKAKLRYPRFSSSCAWCRPHTASPDLSIVWPMSTQHVLDHS